MASDGWFGGHKQGSKVRGAGWAAGMNAFTAAFQIVSAMVLSRLIAPDQFGTFAAMMALYSIITALIGGAFSTSLVQKRDLSEQEASNFFWVAMSVAGLSGVAFAAAGPQIAGFFGDPIYRDLAFAFGALVWLDAAGAQYQALVMRSLRFDILFRIQLVTMPVALAAGVAAALAALGTWALVVHMFVGAALMRLLLVRALGWRPRFYDRAVGVRGMVGFGARMSVGAMIRLAYSRLPVLFLAKAGGATAAGYFNRGDALFKRPFEQAVYPMASLLLPSMSSAAKDLDRLQRLVAQSVWLLMLSAGPLIGFTAVFGDWVALVLLGPQWVEAGEVMRWLAVMAIGTAYRRPLATANAALGRPARAVGLKLALLPAFLVMIFWAAPQGAAFTAAVMAAFYLAMLPLEMLVLMRGLPLRTGPVLATVAASLTVPVVAGTGLAGLRMALPEMIDPAALRVSDLFQLVGIVLTTYALALVPAVAFPEPRAILARLAVLAAARLRGPCRRD